MGPCVGGGWSVGNSYSFGISHISNCSFRIPTYDFLRTSVPSRCGMRRLWRTARYLARNPRRSSWRIFWVKKGRNICSGRPEAPLRRAWGAAQGLLRHITEGSPFSCRIGHGVENGYGYPGHSDPTQPLCLRNAKLKRGTRGICPGKFPRLKKSSRANSRGPKVPRWYSAGFPRVFPAVVRRHKPRGRGFGPV